MEPSTLSVLITIWILLKIMFGEGSQSSRLLLYSVIVIMEITITENNSNVCNAVPV